MSNMATSVEDIELQSSPLMDNNEKNKSETDSKIEKSETDLKKEKTETDSKKEKTKTDFKTKIVDNILFNGCVVLNVLLIISVFIVTIVWLMFVNTEIVEFDAAPNLYCTDCSNVDQSLDREKYFSSIDGNTCCSNKKGEYLEYIMNKHVKKTLEEKFKEKPLFQMCLNTTTAKHPKANVQILTIAKTVKIASGLYDLVHWEDKSSDNSHEFFNNITYNGGGGFRVQRSGFYHIYSRIVFNLKMDNVTFPAIIRHLVLKFRKNYDVGEKLLEGYSTQCETVSATTFSSFVSGDFYISDTDVIKVYLNKLNYIHSEQSYFGMFLT